MTQPTTHQTSTPNNPLRPSSTFRLLSLTHSAPFLKRNLTPQTQNTIKILNSDSDSPDHPSSPLPHYHAIEAIIGERTLPNGQTQFCVVWEGEWPQSEKTQWRDARDVLGWDVLEFRVDMAYLEDAAEGFGEVVGGRGRTARKVTRDRIVLGEEVGKARAMTRMRRGAVSRVDGRAVEGNVKRDAAASNDTDNADAEPECIPEQVEDSEEDAEYEEISMEEWLDLC